MQKTLSTGQEWGGFEGKAYFIDNLGWQIPINETTNGLEKSTTVGDAYLSLCFDGPPRQRVADPIEELRRLRKEGQTFEQAQHSIYGPPRSPRVLGTVEQGVNGLAVTTGQDERRFGGTSFAADLLGAFLRLHKIGANPHDTIWFFYDKDFAAQDVGAAYAFFIVHSDKIVEERVLFWDWPKNGFDPRIFATREYSGSQASIWSDDESWERADTAFWYRKFYAETKTGQLMVLRPDKPELYFWSVGGRAIEDRLAGIDGRLRRINLLLVVLVVIASLCLMVLLRGSP